MLSLEGCVEPFVVPHLFLLELVVLSRRPQMAQTGSRPASLACLPGLPALRSPVVLYLPICCSEFSVEAQPLKAELVISDKGPHETLSTYLTVVMP